jgi:transcriptional regulator with XRE-family HTH domain
VATALRADRLKALRERQGWSQREFGRICGFEETIISKYERAEIDPSTSSLKLMAEKLDVSSDYLLGTTDEPQGFYGRDELTEDEQAVLFALRRDGWRGVARVVAERMPG